MYPRFKNRLLFNSSDYTLAISLSPKVPAIHESPPLSESPLSESPLSESPLSESPLSEWIIISNQFLNKTEMKKLVLTPSKGGEI